MTHWSGCFHLSSSSQLAPTQGMLIRTWASPLSTYNYATRFYFAQPDFTAVARDIILLKPTCSNGSQVWKNLIGVNETWKTNRNQREWILQSTAQITDLTLSDEDSKKWELCRQAFEGLSLSSEEQDRILGKAFGHLHSPYWGEERTKKVPKYETVKAILDYLRSLGLSDDDLIKLLKKFPEILGCGLEDELKGNVQILEREWGISGKSLKSLLIRNPKVLGYNVDCKGDCMAKCTRCWVRF